MEYRVALTAEAEKEVERPVANGLTPEERERRELGEPGEIPQCAPCRSNDCALTGAAWTGDTKRRDSGESIGEEFEGVAVLDRRIAEVRSRIAWFEAAANGNILSPDGGVVAHIPA